MGGPPLSRGGARLGAAVVTVTFTFTAFVPFKAAEAGETVQVARAGAPEQADDITVVVARMR